MKKKILATCIVLALTSQASYATPNRVAALGGETAMITDDDTNIDLFPQQINKQNILRLSGIQSTTPDYAIITGEAGKKWGLYGGATEQSDFFNIYRSLSVDSAVKLGVKIGRYSEEYTDNDKEAAPTINTEKNSYLTMAIDGTYGVNKGDKEIAIDGFFSYGPNAIAALATSALSSTTFGTYELSNTATGTVTKTTGEGNQLAFGVGASVRKPMKIAIFNKVFAQGGASYSSRSSTLSTGAVKAEDSSISTIAFGGRILMFDEKKIGTKSRIIYGIGGAASFFKSSNKDKVTPADSSITILSFTGPQIRLGVESDLKYGTVRFGIQRNLTALRYISGDSTFPSGATPDNNSASSLRVATSGTYTAVTGLGLEYKNLKLDLALNPLFWITGPQMVFATPGTAGNSLAASADMIYTFK